MAVTEVLQGIGSWELSLKQSTPKRITDLIKYFGHIVVHSGYLGERLDDSLLKSSRYTGVVRSLDLEETSRRIGGAGMEFWLGDEEGKGNVFETALTYPVGTAFDVAIRGALPPSGSVLEGTLFTLPSTVSGTFKFQNSREIIKYICDTVGAEYIVRGNATLDAGLESDLFVTADAAIDCAVVRRMSGVDMRMRVLPGQMTTADDVKDFTTRVLLLASGESDSTLTAAASINPVLNPYKDLNGNAVKMTRLISESTTDPTNAPARAQLQLNRFTKPRSAMTLSTEEYDIKGVMNVGDYAWVQDEELGLIDTSKEVIFKGMRLNPVKLRITEINWPVAKGMTVAYRDNLGVWTDLTKWVSWESGPSTLVVGGYNRSLTNSGSEPVGSRPVPNTTIPGVPGWTTPFLFSVYQATNGETRAQVQLKWTRPNNTDGSSILDGDHYDVRYRSSSTPIYPSTHSQMSVFTHAQLAAGTHEQPITYTPGPWMFQSVPWDQLTLLLQDLPTNMPYEAQIRAVDSGTPANAGAWSAVTVFQTSGDTLPPSTPAPPSIAASVIAIQVKHDLGRSDGGTFNLEPDLHHLEVHGQYEPLFTPNAATLLGRLPANKGMMQSLTSAVGTFNTDSTAPVYFKVVAVDNDGNPSQPSTAVQATALLVDDSHISSLTVSKVTAGTITADWLVGAKIISGDPLAARVQLVPAGLEAYNPSGVRTIFLEAATGEGILTGRFQSGITGRRVIINPTSTPVPEIWFEPTPGSVRHAYINSLGGSGDIWLGMNSGPTLDVNGLQTTLVLAPTFSMWSYNTTAGAPGPFSARRGGWFAVSAVDALMGWNDDSTGTEWRYKIDSNGSHSVRGRYQQFVTDGGLSALYVNQVGGSGTNATIGYGATMATVPIPVVDMMPTSGATAGKYHCIGARSTTSFTVEYPAGNCDLFIWAVRYG
jgi:hypothetical protein